MNSIIAKFLEIIYPFWYFLVLGIFFEAAKFFTMFLVSVGKLKGYHAVENYWIYLLVIAGSLLMGVAIGHGNQMGFIRWTVCALLAGMIGIHYGFSKAEALTEEDIKEIRDAANEED